MVREEFFRLAERHLQVRPAGCIDFRAKSSPSPSPTPRQPPLAELVGCVTQWLDGVKAFVRSNSGVLLRSGGGFDKAVYQEMLAVLRPLTLSPPLNTVLIMPNDDEEIMRGTFEQFEDLAKAGGTLKGRVLFPCVLVCVVIQDATSDKL